MKKEIEVVTEIFNKINVLMDQYIEAYDATPISEYAQKYVISGQVKGVARALEEVEGVLDRLYDEDDDALEELIESIND